MLLYKDSQANKGGGIYITKLLFQLPTQLYCLVSITINFKDIWLLRDLNFRSSSL